LFFQSFAATSNTETFDVRLTDVRRPLYDVRYEIIVNSGGDTKRHSAFVEDSAADSGPQPSAIIYSETSSKYRTLPVAEILPAIWRCPVFRGRKRNSYIN